MNRETPEAAFEHARAAMARGDLPEVFAKKGQWFIKLISRQRPR